MNYLAVVSSKILRYQFAPSTLYFSGVQFCFSGAQCSSVGARCNPHITSGSMIGGENTIRFSGFSFFFQVLLAKSRNRKRERNVSCKLLDR